VGSEVITVGTTLTTYAVLDPERAFLWDAWLRNAEAIQASLDDGVRYFVAIQTDARGLDPFAPLLDRLNQLGGDYWTYSLDDGRTEVHSRNRLRHITTGQNLISEYANSRTDCTHLLHMAADCEPPPDVLPKLVEVNNGLAVAYCPTYGLSGETLPGYGFPVTGPSPVASPFAAVCVLLQRDVFKRLRWRYDIEMGMSDDPSLAYDAGTMLGVDVRIRMDCIAHHHPAAISGIEDRFPGLDMGVCR
jgi:hypothetical protein